MQSQVCTVKSIIDIPKKDFIKIMQVKEIAYEFIVNIKDGFNVDDLVVVIVNDSLIPDNPKTKKLSCYELLKEKYYNSKLNRIRTRIVKMAGIRSVGLVEHIDVIDDKKLRKPGTDLDKYFGITKWEPDELEYTPTKNKSIFDSIKKFLYRHFPRIARLIYKNKGLRLSFPFPDHLIPKSDEERAQNIPQIIELYKDKPTIASIKLEGASMTVARDDQNDHKSLIVCSRNLAYRKSDKVNESSIRYINTADKYRFQELLDEHFNKTGEELVLQGELIGPDIQNNIYQLTEYQMRLFRIREVKSGRYYTMNQIADFVNMYPDYKLDMVPIVAHYAKLSDFLTPENIESQSVWMEEHSCFEPYNGLEGPIFHFGEGVPKPKPDKGKYYYNEGLVFVVYDENGNQLAHFKLKSKAYAEWFGH